MKHPILGKGRVDDGEPMLDIEVSYPITYPQKIRMWDVDDPRYQYNDVPVGFFNTFLDAIDGSYCNRTAFGITGDSPKFDATYPDHRKLGWDGPRMCGRFKPTNVISFSFGLFEDQTTVAYHRRQCSEWMKLSLQGVTLVDGSGDAGMYCRKIDQDQKVFRPYALSACPYVISVGSTQIPEGQKPGSVPEIVSRYPDSGGGFSNIFPTPEWQKETVDRYFQENPSAYPFYRTKWGQNVGANGGFFNRAGRAFPDIAVVGENIVAYDNGVTELADGTSASAPIFGAMITRVNEERLRAGMPPVGFISPALYAGADFLFRDVVKGRNTGCDGKKFHAVEGWDPVSGLGTPDFPKLLEYFMNMNCTRG
jgi:tripeptidyl-peptidase I